MVAYRKLRVIYNKEKKEKTMRIAFATQDLTHVNAHFGWAEKMAVYEVSPQGYTFVEGIQFEGQLEEDGNEDKLRPKIEALEGCAMVYVTAIGGPAAARLTQKRIHPVRCAQEETITHVLDKLVHTLNTNPPPWLRKLLALGGPTLGETDG